MEFTLTPVERKPPGRRIKAKTGWRKLGKAVRSFKRDLPIAMVDALNLKGDEIIQWLEEYYPEGEYTKNMGGSPIEPVLSISLEPEEFENLTDMRFYADYEILENGIVKFSIHGSWLPMSLTPAYADIYDSFINKLVETLKEEGTFGAYAERKLREEGVFFRSIKNADELEVIGALRSTITDMMISYGLAESTKLYIDTNMIIRNHMSIITDNFSKAIQTAFKNSFRRVL